MKVQVINKAVYGFLQWIQAECWIALFGIIITAVAWGSVIHHMAHERTDQITDILRPEQRLSNSPFTNGEFLPKLRTFTVFSCTYG